VLALGDISGLTKESMQHHLGDYETGEVSSRDGSALPVGVPEHLFTSVLLNDLVDASRVKMIDLGEG
jgi:hypothetical protein